MLALTLAGCNQGITEDRPEVQSARWVMSDSGEELPPLDNGDGTYSYPLASGFDPDGSLTFGAITWRYERQARFAIEPSPWNPWTFVHTGDPPPSTGLENILNNVRLDAEGRVWVVDDVEIAEWARLIAEANDAVAALGEEVPPEAYADPATKVHMRISGYQPGDEVTLIPASWSDGCTNVDVDKIWDGESRTGVTTLNDRQKATVTIHRASDGAKVCSGVLLDDEHVLTAAHCVTTCNASGQDATWLEGSACSWGNAYSGAACRSSTDIVISDAFDLANCEDAIDSADDWAIMNLSSPMPTSVTDFDTSTLSSLGSREIRTFGFPAKVPGTGTCSNNTMTAINSGFTAHRLYFDDDADITDWSGQIAKGTLDGMNGQSGSPVFYCSGTDDFCNSGEKGIVAMVLASWDPGLADRWSGPRIPAVRDDIIAAMH